MYRKISDTEALVKVYYRKDWVWIPIRVKGQDLYKRGVYDWKECNPKLVQVGKKFFLHISYEKNIQLNQTSYTEQRICAVDLGINQSAVCSIMDSNGTVVARKFIHQPTEKDRLYRMTNKLRKAQRQSGKIQAPTYWRKINGYQKHIVHHTSHEIVKFALKHDCHVIVFEYLSQMKVPKGFYGAKKLRFKLHYWRKIGIQNKVTEMAHYQGMRISRINPRNTSALAFDGSGQVERNQKRDLATFSTGKIYHADLNASYNIGARYFIREIQKSVCESKWLSMVAKVPSLASRTKQTLASLISLQKVLVTNGYNTLSWTVCKSTRCTFQTVVWWVRFTKVKGLPMTIQEKKEMVAIITGIPFTVIERLTDDEVEKIYKERIEPRLTNKNKRSFKVLKMAKEGNGKS